MTPRRSTRRAAEPERVRTGVAGVDEVIAAVEEPRTVRSRARRRLRDAHDQLRRALDAPGDDPA